jgi:hypothetical protein
LIAEVDTTPERATPAPAAAAFPAALHRLTNAAERRVFAFAALLGLVVTVALPFSGFSLVWPSTIPTLAASCALFVVAVIYRTRRPNARIAAMTMGTSALLLFSMAMALSNYLALSLQRPLIDPILAGWDGALGIDWLALVAAVQGLPWLKLVLSVAYMTTLPQIAIVVVILALSGRLERLAEFMLAFCIAALITVAFWAAFPSFGAFAWFWQLDPALADSGLIVDAAYARELYDLQEGRITALSIDELTGLIAFPSFHTAIAVLAAWYLWPVRIAGVAALLLNVLVVMSVPFDGGHHFVDVPAGIVVAALGIVLADLWLSKEPVGTADASSSQAPS